MRTSTVVRASALATLLAVTACSNGGQGAGASAEDTLEAPTSTEGFRDEPSPGSQPDADFLDSTIEEQIADFLESPNSGKSAAIAERMGATGELRWAPWLLDMHRLAQSSIVDDAAAEALGILSGIEPVGRRLDDFQAYGQWAQSTTIDAGPGYREWKLSLYGGIDSEFEALLSQIEDDELLTLVHWGGVTRGQIPELNEPGRLPVAEADWMEPDELVLGAEVNGEAVAYPVRIIGHHELVNDVVAGIPVSMVYCTLCRTGLLFDRRVEGDVLDFQTSGLLLSSNKVMVDLQTDTLWQHLSGTGIAGIHSDVQLVQFPVVTTTWSAWIEEHPDSETLLIPEPTFFPDNPERPPIAYDYEANAAYRSYYDDPDVWFPIFDTPDVFPLKTAVLGIDHQGESLAVSVEALGESGPRVVVVGDRPVLLVPVEGGARAYDGSDLALADGDSPELLDATPELARLATGEELPRLVVAQTFWFAWFGDHQDTATWPAG